MGCLKLRIGVAADTAGDVQMPSAISAVRKAGRSAKHSPSGTAPRTAGRSTDAPTGIPCACWRRTTRLPTPPDAGWSRPPAAREVVYARVPEAAPGVVPRRLTGRRPTPTGRNLPTVARFLLAGHLLPRIEDTVRIGELMRRAALARFGWQHDESTGLRIPKAPWEISGRDADGKPLRAPSHVHAFWLPEDADGDGWIDHVSVFIAGGMNDSVRGALDRITRLWLAPKQREQDDAPEPGSVKEWRLALEDFGRPADFAGGARIFGTSRRWRSVTPFLASGHLKASGYAGEVRRLLRRRGLDVSGVRVDELETIDVGGSPRRAIHFHRFRSRGGEVQPDAAGALLDITLPEAIAGPLAIGYGSHFGLGLFTAVAGNPREPTVRSGAKRTTHEGEGKS